MGWAKASAALLAISIQGCGTPVWQQQSSTNKAREHVVVQFTNATLHPSIARVLPGGNVAWVNYASDVDGTVVFPASIREAFTCSQLRPSFIESAGGYQSIPITGSSMEDVALPCPLKPGEYEYKLLLFEGGTLMGADGAAEMDDPTSEMTGKIIVGE